MSKIISTDSVEHPIRTVVETDSGQYYVAVGINMNTILGRSRRNPYEVGVFAWDAENQCILPEKCYYKERFQDQKTLIQAVQQISNNLESYLKEAKCQENS